MSQAINGDTAKVHYTGTLENGEEFDSSRDREPLGFVIGEGNVIPGFENGVIGMEEGDSKNISIPPEEAYGINNEELIVEINKSEFPENITPSVGLQLQMMQQNGKPINVIITALDDNSVTLYANHPLAGQTLLFDIKLVEIS